MDIRGILTGAAVAAVFGAAGYFAAINMDKPADMPAGEPVQVAGLSEAQQDEVRALVRDTLVTNPEILEEVSAALEQKRADEEAERRKETIAQQKDLIFASAADHAAGNPAGDVTVVEFFDYNCPYCKRALGDINALLKADPNVKVVFKEFPVLSEQSYDAAVVGVAVAKQGLYMEFHDKLLSHQGRADKALALQIASRSRHGEAGSRHGRSGNRQEYPQHPFAGLINGTPAYVIGDEVLVGLAPLAGCEAGQIGARKRLQGIC
ncbi:MAG: thioredoxin domain-containing protein [Tepidamorphaceae bacterium]